jgi:two-component system nitrate/nitrite response regulator NarL
LQLISEGKTNKDIARALDITEATVKVHVKNLFKKLSLRSRVEAALWAVKQKMV